MLIFILPTLILLMFGLGLNLSLTDFKRVGRNRRALLTGLSSQLILLPLVAHAIGILFRLPPLFHAGLVLIALCPGGVTSNTFTLIAGGDVALSVTLTVISSFVSVATIPLVFAVFMPQFLAGSAGAIATTTPKLIIQIFVTTILPVSIGMLIRTKKTIIAANWHEFIKKISAPLLFVSVLLYFISKRDTVIENTGALLSVTSILAAVTMGIGALLSHIMRLSITERRTIIIETGMQNAAQAIAIGANTMLVSDTGIAIPAIIYAIAMNITCFIYAYAVILRNR